MSDGVGGSVFVDGYLNNCVVVLEKVVLENRDVDGSEWLVLVRHALDDLNKALGLLAELDEE